MDWEFYWYCTPFCQPFWLLQQSTLLLFWIDINYDQCDCRLVCNRTKNHTKSIKVRYVNGARITLSSTYNMTGISGIICWIMISIYLNYNRQLSCSNWFPDEIPVIEADINILWSWFSDNFTTVECCIIYFE